MRVTGTAQREAWLARTSPPVEQVRPDRWSVPVPIPGSPLRYTLSYLIAAGVAVNDDALAAVRAMAKPGVLLEHGDLVPLPGRPVWTPRPHPGAPVPV